MGLFDPWYLGQGGNGLLGGYAQQYEPKDIEALIRGYGPQWGSVPKGDAPQIPFDPSGSTPIGGAPPNPYGQPNGLMPTPTTTFPSDPAITNPAQSAGGSWIKPGSFLDKLVNNPPGVGAAQAAPAQPSMNPADYSQLASAFGIPSAAPQPPNAPQQPNVPRPAMQAQNGLPSDSPNNGTGIYSGPAEVPGFGFKPLVSADAQLPPNARPAQGQMPPAMAPQSRNFNPLTSIGDFFSGLDPSQRPQLQETGTDPFTGQKTFAWVSPGKQTITAAQIGAAPGGTSAPAQSLGAFSEAVRAGVSGEALYQHLPAEMRNTVKSMIEGRSQLPTAAAMRNPQVMALINAANAIDPTFDATEWGKRSALVKNYMAGGKQFQEMQAIGTVAGHLVNLKNAAEGLDNTPYPMVNGVKNWLLQNAGDPRVTKFATDIQAVSNELSRAYRGGHVTEGDVKKWNDSINSAQSPAQLRTAIGELNDLLKSKREQIEHGYTQGMGKNPLPKEFTAESERSRQNFDNVAKWAGGEKPAQSGWTVKKL